VGDVAGERAPRGRQIDEALRVGQGILLLGLDGVGEAQDVALGDVDGEDAAGHDVEVAGHGVERVLLGSDETEVVVELDEVRPLGDAGEEARVLGLNHPLQPRAELHTVLAVGQAELVGGLEQPQPERVHHGVEREGLDADAGEAEPPALLKLLGVARIEDDFDDREGGDDLEVQREDVAADLARLLVLEPATPF
jgi:hypothetical protein